MPKVGDEFSVVPQHQLVESATLAQIGDFIRLFDRVTARPAWHEAALRHAPAIAQARRKEVCFFSAWDFHLSPEGFKLIEFNDNGSGFLFAALINALYYQAAGLAQEKSIAAPATRAAIHRQIGTMVGEEAKAFFGGIPADLFLILDDAQSLREGKFRQELELLRNLFRECGWRSQIASPTETRWDGKEFLLGEQRVSFIVNRSTDFLWQADECAALRRAYEADRVYVAPNPFTYTTRSDKRLLEWLSLWHWDDELGIKAEERQILSAHVPETYLVRVDDADMLAQHKHEFVFKPIHGFAGRGLLASEAVGRERLRRLARHGDGYVAQRWTPKACIEAGGARLWADLRVWAYRGEIYLLSGRASQRQDRLDLTAPGGWLPTFVTT